ncbi:hypothetical protein JW905_00890 [bacterium]|nr:hypothetical protein [candidate division CSSED10-310 bacterium]
MPSGRWEVETILDFDWPQGAGAADGIMFWGGFPHPGTVRVADEISLVRFDYE